MKAKQLLERFKNRQVVIATKHKKEDVIAPVLLKRLGLQTITSVDLDTDVFGTFSGEIERKNDALETARQKCRLALDSTNCDIAIASEGSFGPHPGLGFVNADDELLVFIDLKLDLEIVVREVSLKTNFNGQEVKTQKELFEFAKNAKFPSHGLILRKSQNDNSIIVKGITERDILNETFNDLINKYGSVYVETDMRAMYNPTRMNVIKKATKKLAEKIASCCPQCTTPGFGLVQSIPGLPCATCGFPTRSILSHQYQCKKCNYSEEKKYPYGKMTEEAMYCDYCNP